MPVPSFVGPPQENVPATVLHWVANKRRRLLDIEYEREVERSVDLCDLEESPEIILAEDEAERHIFAECEETRCLHQFWCWSRISAAAVEIVEAVEASEQLQQQQQQSMLAQVAGLWRRAAVVPVALPCRPCCARPVASFSQRERFGVCCLPSPLP